MKTTTYLVLGVSIQIGENPPECTDICDTAWSLKNSTWKPVTTLTIGTVKIDEKGTIINSCLTDQHGRSALSRFIKEGPDGSETISFKKHYNSQPVVENYQLTKAGGIYLGHFQVEGYGKESEGWCKWQLTPVADDFFELPEFLDEMMAEIQRRALK